MAAVPHGVLLDYTYNDAHFNHVHVEPPTQFGGVPPSTNPGMSPGVRVIYDALTDRFGRGAYFMDTDHHWEDGKLVIDDPNIFWTHMGGYNRRYIGGTTTWSQHSWWNALDIGPYYYGDQDIFVDFLKGVEVDLRDERFNDEIGKILYDLAYAVRDRNSHGSAIGFLIDEIRKDIITREELTAALQGITQGNVDSVARQMAQNALNKLAAIKGAI